MAKKQLFMTETKKNTSKKFIWDEILNQTPKKEHDKLVKTILPQALGIRYETLNNYRNIPAGSSKDIPSTINLRLCLFFNVNPIDSVLDKLEPICVDSELGVDQHSLAKNLGLSA